MAARISRVPTVSLEILRQKPLPWNNANPVTNYEKTGQIEQESGQHHTRRPPENFRRAVTGCSTVIRVGATIILT